VLWFGVAGEQGALMAAIARERPVLWRALRDDAPLRGRMLAASSAAYQAGGWPAAAPILDQLSYKMIMVFAGDHALAACNAAWLSARQALLARPNSCALFLDGGRDAFIAAQIRATAPACDAALAQGAALRRRGEMPRIPCAAWPRSPAPAILQPCLMAWWRPICVVNMRWGRARLWPRGEKRRGSRRLRMWSARPRAPF
jgi:hypothetical protein